MTKLKELCNQVPIYNGLILFYPPFCCSTPPRLCLLSLILKISSVIDSPGGPVVKNLPANARNTGLILDLGRLHMHVMGKLSLCTTATEACPSAETSGAKNKKTCSVAYLYQDHVGVRMRKSGLLEPIPDLMNQDM